MKELFSGMRTKVYISVPINGRKEETLLEKRIKAIEYSEKIKGELVLSGYDAITPFDVCCKDADENECIGKDITALLNSDAIYLCAGWRNSKGCQLELLAAQIYGKEIIKDEL